ncbi:MAG: hypothetical protein MJ232_08515, partial [archaeon]|nr:hypothetical protein [archaeon]
DKLILFSTLPSTKIWNDEHLLMIKDYPENVQKVLKNNDVNYISNEGIIKSLNLKVMNSKGVVGRPVLLNASVKDGDNHIINNGNVEFYIGGEYVGVSKLINGFATLNYTPNLSGNIQYLLYIKVLIVLLYLIMVL